MMTEELCHLSATRALELMRQGEITSEELVSACLARIEKKECDIGAWEYINPAQALTQARERDRSGLRGDPRFLLHGLPVGIKDVCDTHDMPTTYGSRSRQGHRPAMDATCVTHLRSGGGIILGKTVTTEFAGRFPGRTANPHDVRRTPGGSSSGSAAAVADFMVPLAVSTQTVGSTIRPAAYCGIIGYKPTFGHLSFQGVHHLAETFDTLGCMARSIEDVELLRSALSGFQVLETSPPRDTPLRIGFCRTIHWGEADESTRSSLENACDRFTAAGAAVDELVLPDQFNKIYEIALTVFLVEHARSIAPEVAFSSENLSSVTRGFVADACRVEARTYFDALKTLDETRAAIDVIMGRYDVVVTPSAVGEAGIGHEDTGSVIFNILWQSLGLPCLTLPLGTGVSGMPLGIQLIGARHGDSALLSAGKWISTVLGDKAAS